MDIQVVDKTTGEILPVTLDKKEIETFVGSLTDEQKSQWLTKANFVRRLASNLESSIKAHIKKVVIIEDGRGVFEDWKVQEVSTTRFSESELLASGNEKDIKDWNRLKNKYSKTTSYLKI